MKRHVSIFAFLLGALAATEVVAAGSQSVTAWGYWAPGADSPYVHDEKWFPDPNSVALWEWSDPQSFSAKLPEGWKVRHWRVSQPQEFTDGSPDSEGSELDGSAGKAVVTWEYSSHYGAMVYLAVKYDYIKYNLKYDLAGGSGTAKGTNGVSYVDEYALAAAPSKTGYTFRKWKASSNGAEFVAGATVSGKDLCPDTWHADGSNVTMTAQWTTNTYTVMFNGNGGTPSPESKIVTYDSEYGALASCERQGWKFDGWYTATDGGTKVEPTTKVTITENQILYAHWTQKFTVTFYEASQFWKGETEDTGIIAVREVESGESVKDIPSDPEHPGYVFNGWSGNYSSVIRDEKVRATYTGNSYTVRFNANDGSGRRTTQQFEYGKDQALLLNPLSRIGYTLRGWADSQAPTVKKYDPGEMVSNLAMGGTVDLYALWTPISYTVAFDGNGGEGKMDGVRVEFGSEYVVPECAFTKQGCEFRSWSVVIGGVATNFEAGTVVSNLTSEADATMTFKAEWAGYYTVAFDRNGGEGTMTNVTFEQNVECQLPSNAFVKTGYRFFAWDDVLNGKRYEDGARVCNLAQAGETNALKAVWSTNTYTVVFLPGGAKGTMEDQEFLYDRPQVLRDCTFSRGDPALWSFAGWTNSAAGGPLYTNQETVVNLTADPDGCVELTAVWTSELSDLALAMRCENLNWSKQLGTWKAGEIDGVSCAMSDPENAYAYASMKSQNMHTNGTLRFSWKSTGGDQAVALYSASGASITGKSWDLKGEIDKWHSCEIDVDFGNMEAGYVVIYHWHGDDGTSCYITKMTWTPAGGSEHPVPTDADKVTISSAAVSDGKFVLSFKSDEKFDYNLLTNANLHINSWGILDVFVGDGSVHTFKPEIRDEQPQLFYKVDTIQRK